MQRLLAIGRHEYLIIAGECLVHDLDINGLIVNHQELGFTVRMVDQIGNRSIKINHGLIMSAEFTNQNVALNHSLGKIKSTHRIL